MHAARCSLAPVTAPGRARRPLCRAGVAEGGKVITRATEKKLQALLCHNQELTFTVWAAGTHRSILRKRETGPDLCLGNVAPAGGLEARSPPGRLTRWSGRKGQGQGVGAVLCRSRLESQGSQGEKERVPDDQGAHPGSGSPQGQTLGVRRGTRLMMAQETANSHPAQSPQTLFPAAPQGGVRREDCDGHIRK